jgi:hypothetical protein
MIILISQSKFALGQLSVTSNALTQIPMTDLSKGLCRHAIGDWGELDVEDKAANDEALSTGGRIVSAYRSASGLKFLIITEWDRSATTILLPEDY